MYKQIIIARKDLNMSPGKLAAQVAHGSMAFLVSMIRDDCSKVINEKIGRVWEDSAETKPQCYRRNDLSNFAKIARENGERLFYYKPVNQLNPCGELELCNNITYDYYESRLSIEKDLYEQWIVGEFTKCVLQAKDKGQLLKAKIMAEDMGMKEGEDFFLIRDNCHTELKPEEEGRTLTVIGFRPMDSETVDKIGKKYHLYS